MKEKRRATILVVEDDRSTRSLLKALLNAEHDVALAPDGQTALVQAVEISPDLILLDIGLGGLDGLTVCRQLKADPLTKEIPVIFLTKRSSAPDEVAGLEAGGVDYIAKPIDALILTTRVRIHLELKSHRDTLARMASTDGLTGIANRYAYDDFLSREWRRLDRARKPLGVIMIDIDYFKQYNDTYGHIAGDSCLKQVAKAIGEALLRPADIVARYGGEEFIVLLPETSLDGALAVAENIRAVIAGLGIPHKSSKSGAHITVSLGVACTVPQIDKDPALLVGTADTQLYRAKEAGRNSVLGTALEF